jgi:hypothetical protein
MPTLNQLVFLIRPGLLMPYIRIIIVFGTSSIFFKLEMVRELSVFEYAHGDEV